MYDIKMSVSNYSLLGQLPVVGSQLPAHIIPGLVLAKMGFQVYFLFLAAPIVLVDNQQLILATTFVPRWYE
jgi:hypothetical protein